MAIVLYNIVLMPILSQQLPRDSAIIDAAERAEGGRETKRVDIDKILAALL